MLPFIQGPRPGAGDIQFGSVDNFSSHMSTPTSVAPPQQDALSEANAAQKQFLQVSSLYAGIQNGGFEKVNHLQFKMSILVTFSKKYSSRFGP